MPEDNHQGLITVVSCDKCYKSLKENDEFILGMVNSMGERIEKGFGEINKKIDSEQRAQIKLMWMFLRWVGAALLAACGFIVWQFAIGNLKLT